MQTHIGLQCNSAHSEMAKVKLIHSIERIFVKSLTAEALRWHKLSKNCSFTFTPTRLSTNGMNRTYLCLPSRSWSSFTDHRRYGGWVGQDTTTVRKQSAQDRYVTTTTVVSCSNGHASLDNWSAEAKRRMQDLSGHLPRRSLVNHQVSTKWCRRFFFSIPSGGYATGKVTYQIRFSISKILEVCCVFANIDLPFLVLLIDN